jgi:hypothetical protein
MARSTKTGPSTTTRTAVTGQARRVSAATAGVVGSLSVAGAFIGNLAALALGRIAGADMVARPPGAPEDMQIGVLTVAAMTIGALAVGTIGLAVAARWGIPAWRTLAWAGLAVGIVSVVMPFGATAGVSTKLTLASMHVITGVVWLVVVRRGLTRAGQET